MDSIRVKQEGTETGRSFGPVNLSQVLIQLWMVSLHQSWYRGNEQEWAHEIEEQCVRTSVLSFTRVNAVP
jgi:hypothetical protein